MLYGLNFGPVKSKQTSELRKDRFITTVIGVKIAITPVVEKWCPALGVF